MLDGLFAMVSSWGVNPTFWVTCAVLLFLGMFGRKALTAIVQGLDAQIAQIAQRVSSLTTRHHHAQETLTSNRARRQAVLTESQGLIDTTQSTIAQLEAQHRQLKDQRDATYAMVLEQRLDDLRRAHLHDTHQKLLALCYKAAYAHLEALPDKTFSPDTVQTMTQALEKTRHRLWA